MKIRHSRHIFGYILACALCALVFLCAAPHSHAMAAAPALPAAENNASAIAPALPEMAAALKELSLFQGTALGLELDKPCDRLMGAVILVRLLGGEQEALGNAYVHPFRDVEGSYASPHIGYLYHNGMSSGISAAIYGRGEMTAQQFATLLLRALGYRDNEDFQWQNALETMSAAGILPQDELEQLQTGVFLRGHAALLCYRALLAQPKNADKPLVHRLLWQNAFSTRQLAKSHDAALLLAADMPDAMTFQVSAYSEQQFRDIVWLSLRNRQSNLVIYAPSVTPRRAQDILSELTAPYFMRDFWLDLQEWENSTYYLSSYIAEYMSMQFYYEDTQRYTKNYQLYEQQYRRPAGDYISIYVWRETVNALLEQLISEDMSEYERLKTLHDYLAANIVYDYEADNRSASHFAEGVLMQGKGVCDGYASALKMLLNGAGIECRVIYGTSLEELHAWNQVKIDGQWYNVDVTWASTIDEDSIYYGYFCAPDNIFLRDHAAEKEGIMQPCTATDLYRR